MTTWKFTFACTRAEADLFTDDVPQLADFDPPPVVMTSEPDESKPDSWQLDVYTVEHPSLMLIETVSALLPSAGGAYTLVELDDEDWVTMSQAGLDPVEAGRFFVHTAADADTLPAGRIGLQIEAGLAFGTGQHATTTGCLLTLDALDVVPKNALDLGTGTAILALAVVKTWPEALVTASDIDPVAIRVSRENTEVNMVNIGDAKGEISLHVADGLEDAALAARGPFDLVVANILAGPLIEMAPSIAAALAPGGTLILAGLLAGQADAVEAAYRDCGITPVSRTVIGEWPTLRLLNA
ncbi:ribosomal protein L11 methyltransferase [Sphingosinicella soli]|uniref:Ribosomal protein L11 methyltransferase n=2 Tax=Sphingosinicella soli TaxID=333708 RepID=A0A7W7F7S4_9SPHN|nr:ribosomal protein L11 methyltransferase [Sphingosinicella soli]